MTYQTNINIDINISINAINVGINRYIENISSKTAEYTLFSSAHETFSRIYHMQSHKTGLNKFKKIKIISSVFSNHMV